MESSQTSRITQKAEQTRQRILDSSLELFATKGYEGTTMRDIATRAECSLGLAYRYFAGKEDLVLELYRCLARELEAQVRELPATSLADRFQRTVQAQLALMAPYRDTLGALFGAALNPRSRAGVFGEGSADVRRQTRNLFILVASGAKDAVREPQLDHLATVLYGMHLLLVLFWLQDRSEGQQNTNEALSFAHDMLALLRPLLRISPVAPALARLARILGPMFGDDSAHPR